MQGGGSWWRNWKTILVCSNILIAAVRWGTVLTRLLRRWCEVTDQVTSTDEEKPKTWIQVNALQISGCIRCVFLALVSVYDIQCVCHAGSKWIRPNVLVVIQTALSWSLLLLAEMSALWLTIISSCLKGAKRLTKPRRSMLPFHFLHPSVPCTVCRFSGTSFCLHQRRYCLTTYQCFHTDPNVATSSAAGIGDHGGETLGQNLKRTFVMGFGMSIGEYVRA